MLCPAAGERQWGKKVKNSEMTASESKNASGLRATEHSGDIAASAASASYFDGVVEPSCAPVPLCAASRAVNLDDSQADPFDDLEHDPDIPVSGHDLCEVIPLSSADGSLGTIDGAASSSSHLNVLRPVSANHVNFFRQVDTAVHDRLLRAGQVVQSPPLPGQVSLSPTALPHTRADRFREHALQSDIVRRLGISNSSINSIASSMTNSSLALRSSFYVDLSSDDYPNNTEDNEFHRDEF